MRAKKKTKIFEIVCGNPDEIDLRKAQVEAEKAKRGSAQDVEMRWPGYAAKTFMESVSVYKRR